MLSSLSPDLFSSLSAGRIPLDFSDEAAQQRIVVSTYSHRKASQTEPVPAHLESILVRRKRSELAMTLTEDNAIAAAAIVGDKSRPNVG